jgi:putative Holliday junction resolvase
MRVLGLDVGSKTIGVSISDELGLTAQGVTVIQRTEQKHDLAQIEDWIKRFDVNHIVIGLPKNMDGSVGEMGEACQRFAQEIENRTGLPVTLWDERLSTRFSERVLIEANLSRKKRKQVIDKMAAVVILQSYLDSIRSRKE